MGPILEIRGIYATALTRLFLDSGMAISRFPSEVSATQVLSGAGPPAPGPSGVHITDIPGGQGVLIQGPREELAPVIRHLQQAFVDVICRPAPGPDGIAVEFACLAKSVLDDLRNATLPTLFNHHRLSLIAPESVDLVEKRDLAGHPELRESLSRTLEDDLVWSNYRNGGRLKIEHVKLDGRVLYLSEGEIIEVAPELRQVTLRRSEFKGRTTYDGLGIPKDYGDYAVTVIREEWFYRHTYFRRHGELIGAYYNINTRVEFYPDRVRYVDLEVDVVAWPDGRTEITDEDELQERCERGYITPELRDRAMETAYQLLALARGSRQTGKANHPPVPP